MKVLHLLHKRSTLIRHAAKGDCEQLLQLMKKLAVFENYIDDFAVTEADLISHGFPLDKNKLPSFTAIVAERKSELVGYLVYYQIPFTYDLKPTLFIKELYVDKASRGESIGKQLMQAAIADAKEKDCGRMKWDVLSDNIKAQSFYQSLGASFDARWQGYVLEIPSNV